MNAPPQTTVSVVLPVYNGEALLAPAIDSVVRRRRRTGA